MPEVATLNAGHSTARIVTSEKPKIAVDPESKEPTLLFAPSDITVEGGLIGFILYVFAIAALLIFLLKLYAARKHALFLFPSCVAMLVCMVGLSAIINEAFLFFLGLVGRYGFEEITGRSGDKLSGNIAFDT